MRTIYFKKQALGKWRRDDGETKLTVTYEVMHRECQKLLDEGWHLRTEGRTFLRGITMFKVVRSTRRVEAQKVTA